MSHEVINFIVENNEHISHCIQKGLTHCIRTKAQQICNRLWCVHEIANGYRKSHPVQRNCFQPLVPLPPSHGTLTSQFLLLIDKDGSTHELRFCRRLSSDGGHRSLYILCYPGNVSKQLLLSIAKICSPYFSSITCNSQMQVLKTFCFQVLIFLYQE